MYKKLISIIALISCIWSASCTDTIDVIAGDYSKNYSGGDSLAIGDITNISPLRNPDRGFHLESNYFADNLTNPFNATEVYPNGFIGTRENAFKTAGDSLTLTQLYIYLTAWVDKPISQDGLDNIQKMFDGLRDNGYKAILRFAYNWEGLNTSGGESQQWITYHQTQLKPIIEKNLGLITTIQVGFIGAWGEWHTSPLQNNQNAKNATVNGLLDIYPAPYCIQIRTPDHKNALTLAYESDKSRIGYANDYFTAGEHTHAPGNDFVPDDAWYKQAQEESPYFFMSGEIPYNENTEWGLSTLINPMNTLRVFRDHHYSAFDVTQNFDLNIASWKKVKVYPALLKTNRILFSEDYFKDENGKNVARSFYQFVRDHLGYRLNLLSSTNIKSEGGNLVYDIKFTNTGFATVVNPKLVYLVLISENNAVAKEIKLEVNPKDWQPFDPAKNTYEALVHNLKGSASVGGLTGKYKVGIWMPDTQENIRNNNAYDVEWALNKQLTHWKDNANKYTLNVISEVVF